MIEDRSRMTGDILPDDVLLSIFDFLVVAFGFEAAWWWTLVHVCRKWRNVIFGSPHRLELRLVCSDRTPVKEMLDIWPPFPIIVIHWPRQGYAGPKSGWDNIIAALEHNDRVCQIKLKLDLQWEKVLGAMQEPFPSLTHLALLSDIDVKIAPVVPVSFIGGSASRLQDFWMTSVSIPGLPKLLSSTIDLVHLDLRRIPHSGYISPEEIVTCLSTLPRLRSFCLGFESRRSRPNRNSRHLPPPTRSVLPALVKLTFIGVNRYLEDLVARIDTPLLDCLKIELYNQPEFDTPQLNQFISRTPMLEVHDQANVDFFAWNVRIGFFEKSSGYNLSLKIIAKGRELEEWHLSSPAQLIPSSFPRSFTCMVEQLTIRERSRPTWLYDIIESQWLDLLRPFTGVKDLYLSKEIAQSLLPELVEGSTTEVLPVLENLSLEEHPSGPFEEIIGKFVAARQLSNHPVAISQRM